MFMHVSRFISTILLVLVIPGLLLGCDSEGNTPDVPDDPVFSFTLSESGSSRLLEGSATWTEGTSNSGEQAFGIVFNTRDQTSSGFLTREGSSPSSGSYTIASLESAAFAPLAEFTTYFTVDAGGNNLPQTYVSTGGTMTIDGADSNTISGSFDIDLVRFEVVNGQQQEIPASIQGTFTAQQVSSIGIIN